MPRRAGASTIARKPSGLAVTILGLVVLAVVVIALSATAPISTGRPMNAQHRALIGARRRAGPAAVLGTLSSVALEQSQPSAEAAPAAAKARATEARAAEARAAAATAAASAAVTTQTGPEATVRVDPPPVLPLRLSGGDAVAAPAAVPRAVPL